jgi:hypothetical protein
VGVGGFVHLVPGPLLEPAGLDGLALVGGVFGAVEVVAGAHLQEAVGLLAHGKRVGNKNI